MYYAVTECLHMWLSWHLTCTGWTKTIIEPSVEAKELRKSSADDLQTFKTRANWASYNHFEKIQNL